MHQQLALSLCISDRSLHGDDERTARNVVCSKSHVKTMVSFLFGQVGDSIDVVLLLLVGQFLDRIASGRQHGNGQQPLS